MASRGYQTISPMTAVFDPIRNGVVWSLVIKTPPVDCLRGSLGTIIVGKDSIPRGDFTAQ